MYWYTGSCEQYLSMQLLDLERYVPLERCRLVRYDDYSETLDQSFEEQEVGGGRRGRGGGEEGRREERGGEGRRGEERGGEGRRGMGNREKGRVDAQLEGR